MKAFVGIVRRARRFSPFGGQRDVFLAIGGPGFQFVDARFRRVRRQDHKTHAPRGDRREPFNIFCHLHSRSHGLIDTRVGRRLIGFELPLNLDQFRLGPREFLAALGGFVDLYRPVFMFDARENRLHRIIIFL